MPHHPPPGACPVATIISVIVIIAIAIIIVSIVVITIIIDIAAITSSITIIFFIVILIITPHSHPSSLFNTIRADMMGFGELKAAREARVSGLDSRRRTYGKRPRFHVEQRARKATLSEAANP